jgi:hypothetical protein
VSHRIEPLTDGHELDTFTPVLDTWLRKHPPRATRIVIVDAIDDNAASFYRAHAKHESLDNPPPRRQPSPVLQRPDPTI